MSDVERVTLNDVHRVAELSNLELTPEEETRMRRDLDAILGYVAQLAELDTTHVEPMAQVSEVLTVPGEQSTGKMPVLRDDVPRPCLDRELVMASAPETDSVFFKVPKVIER